MYNIEYLDQYIAFVDFYAQICGYACEIVLYDVSSPSSSIIAIHNPMDGQKKGDPLSADIQNMIDSRVYIDRNYLINYKKNSEESIYSAYFIKDYDKLIGVLRICKDISMVSELETLFKAMLDKHSLSIPREKIERTNENAVVALLQNMIESEINETGIHPARLTLHEKVRLVHKLSEKGALMIDGAISEIANQLMISEPTVYRYLNRSVN